MPVVTPDEIKNLIFQAFRYLEQNSLIESSGDEDQASEQPPAFPIQHKRACSVKFRIECMAVHNNIKRAYPWIAYGFTPGRFEADKNSFKDEMCLICHNYDQEKGCACVAKMLGMCNCANACTDKPN